MAGFSARPVIGSDPWGSVREAYDVSLENAINGVEADVTTKASSASVTALTGRVTATELVANAALPSASFDTRLGTRVKVDNTVGRTAHVWDATNSRWQLVYGDTGWRNVSASLSNGWTAAVAIIRRVGHTVEIRLTGLDPTAATADAVFALPAGFTSNSSYGSPRAPYYMASSIGTALVSANVTPPSRTAGAVTASWTTIDPWPTTLPGTASGTIPNA